MYLPLWALHFTDKITTHIKLFPCKQSKTVEDNEFQQSFNWITLCCYKKHTEAVGKQGPPHINIYFPLSCSPQCSGLILCKTVNTCIVRCWSNWLLGALGVCLPLPSVESAHAQITVRDRDGSQIAPCSLLLWGSGMNESKHKLIRTHFSLVCLADCFSCAIITITQNNYISCSHFQASICNSNQSSGDTKGWNGDLWWCVRGKTWLAGTIRVPVCAMVGQFLV